MNFLIINNIVIKNGRDTVTTKFREETYEKIRTYSIYVTCNLLCQEEKLGLMNNLSKA